MFLLHVASKLLLQIERYFICRFPVLWITLYFMVITWSCTKYHWKPSWQFGNLFDAGEGWCTAIRDVIMVFGGALPHRVQYGQVLSLSSGCCSCAHGIKHSCKRSLLLGSCPSTTFWVHCIPAEVCDFISFLLCSQSMNRTPPII
jgi:hypothetical protein